MAYFFPIILSFSPFPFPLLPFRPFLSGLFPMFRWWGANELNHMQGMRENMRGDWVESNEIHFVPFFTLVSSLFFPSSIFHPCPTPPPPPPPPPPSECLQEQATSSPTSTSKDFVSIAKTLLYMHFKVQQTRSYPKFVISGQHTCRAMGSNVKSQESPTESSRASSIAFN